MSYPIFVLIVRLCVFGLILHAAATDADKPRLWWLLAIVQLAGLLPKPQ